VQASLDLVRGPVLRAALIELGSPSGQRERRLLLAVHHLVIDGVAWRLVLEDLARCLAAGVEPAPTRAETSSAPTPAATPTGLRGEPLPPKTTSYRRWAERLTAYAETPEAGAELASWTALAGRPVRSLPLDVPEAAAGGDTEGTAAAVEIQLGEDETRALLQEVPRPYRTRIDDALLTALARAFGRWTGGTALRVDLEAHGREELFADVDLSRTVGCFTALYPALLDLAGTATPAEALKAVKEQLRAVPRHGVGFGILRHLAGPDVAKTLDAIPPAEVSFNYLGQLDGALPEGSPFAAAAEPAGAIGAIRSPRSPRPCRLELLGSVAGGRLRLVWRYDTRALHRATVERLAAGFLAELRELIAHCLSPEAGGLTPTDVPLAGLDQTTLDQILGQSTGPQQIADLYPLSPLQQGMLFHSLLAPGTGVYVVQGVSTLAGAVDPDLLRRAWQGALDRHPILRTAFLWQGLAEPLQAVHRRADLPFTIDDWRHLDDDEKQRRFAALLAADRERGFDLDRPPLLRIALVRWAEREWRQIWSHHHLLLDAWSGPLVTAEVAALYRSLERGEELRLPERRPFRDFIAWLQSRDTARSETYWRRQLQGLQAPTPLGFDHAAPPADRAAHGHAEATNDLTEITSAALAAGARRHRLTQSTLLQAAWALLLARTAATDLVVFGVTVAGRPPELPGAEGIVGPFINTLPVRAEVSPGAPLLPWLEALQTAQAALSEHEQTPLVLIQGWSEVPRDQPLFDSLLLVENLPTVHLPADSDTGFEVTAGPPLERTNYPVTVIATPGERFRLRLAWQTDRLDAPTAQRVLGHLSRLLEGLAGSLAGDLAGDRTADIRLDHLDLLSAAERQQLQVEWGAPTASFRSDVPLHELFEAQVRRQPQAPALTSNGATLTYAELDAWADHLAHRLRHLGVGPEVRVAVCAERSPALVAALLAVLKAGGAYVPLDPAYPAERLAWLLSDSAAAVLLADASDVDSYPTWADRPNRVPYLELSPSGPGLTSPQPPPGQPDVPDPKAAFTDAAAYVLYTSGSTGQPKGVIVPHAAVTRLLSATDPWFGFGPDDVWTLFHSYAFDFSVWELWGALAFGGRLVIVPRDTARSAEDFLRLLSTERVTVLNQTPSAFRPLAAAAVADAAAPPLALRTVIFGGEALEPTSLAPWFARFGDTAPRLVNMYGITETTVHVTYRPLTAADTAITSSPIGQPIPDLALHLTDPHLRLSP
ncbi:MAG TPA: condensation domain-containing protein, partial [Thermoanaerobaculia bacterium]|nr:condensation domain-containing protein [Thermoanaerobaculia bacterium]